MNYYALQSMDRTGSVMSTQMVRASDVLALLRKAYTNTARAYQRGVEDGERRQMALQNKIYWAALQRGTP